MVALGIVASVVFLGAPGSSSASPSSWFWQNPIPQGNDLLDMAFEPGGLRGYAVGRSGAFIRTDCAGALWVDHATRPDPLAAYRSVSAPEADVVWVTDATGALWCSSDAGLTWQRRDGVNGDAGDRVAPRGCTVVRFRDARLGWVGTEAGTILRTEDGGLSWAACPAPAISGPVHGIFDSGSILYAEVLDDYRRRVWRSVDGRRWTALDALPTSVAMDFATPLVGLVVTGTHTARSTSDAGETWTLSRPPIMVGAEEADATLAWMPTDKLAYIFTNHGRVLRSDDGGRHWTRAFRPTFLDRYGGIIGGPPRVAGLRRCAARTFLYGGAGAIIYSTDDGNSYQALSADFVDDLEGVSFCDGLHGIAVTHGALIVTSDGGAAWHRQSVGTDLYLRSVRMVGDVGWAAGMRWSPGHFAECVIVRLRRSGERVEVRLQELPSARGGGLNDVWTNDGVTCWAGGSDAAGAPLLFKTSDGGATWHRVTLPGLPDIGGLYAREIINVRVFADGTGWALAKYGRVWLLRTEDGGENWTHLADGPVDGDCLGAIDGRTCFVGRAAWPGDAWLNVTRDGGETWSEALIDVRADLIWYPSLEAITFADDRHGALAIGGVLLITADAGVTWDEVPTRTAGLHDIAWHGRSAWGVGVGGTVVYNGGETGDFRPPVTRSSVPTGWSGSDATVYLAPNDQCGVEETWWTFGDAGAAAVTARAEVGYRRYTGPIKIRTQGTTPITVYSVDVHGNRESPRVYYVRVDKKKPWTKRYGRRIARHRVRLRLRAFDRLSGVRSISYQLDKRRVVTARRASVKVTVKQRGKHVLRYWASDRAGHRSKKITVRIVVR